MFFNLRPLYASMLPSAVNRRLSKQSNPKNDSKETKWRQLNYIPEERGVQKLLANHGHQTVRATDEKRAKREQATQTNAACDQHGLGCEQIRWHCVQTHNPKGNKTGIFMISVFFKVIFIQLSDLFNLIPNTIFTYL